MRVLAVTGVPTAVSEEKRERFAEAGAQSVIETLFGWKTRALPRPATRFLQVRRLIVFRPPPSKHICGGVSPWGETGMSRRPKSVPPRAEKFPKGAAARRLIAKEAVATQSQNLQHIQQTTRFTYASIYTCSHVAAAARPRGPRRPRRKPDST